MVAPVLEEGGGVLEPDEPEDPEEGDPDDEEDDAAGTIRVGVNVAGACDSRSFTGVPTSSAAYDVCTPFGTLSGASIELGVSAAQGTWSLESFVGSVGSPSGPEVLGEYAGLPMT